MQFSVSPCLFIGIGTTGAMVLEHLRQHVAEEFGRAGLPCFRYLVIETDGSKKAKDAELGLPHELADYEQIKYIHTVIKDIETIREQRMDPNRRESYLRGVEDWLDQSLLEHGQKKYTAGAGHIRQAGRLCLWSNWREVRSQLSQAYANIHSVAATPDTEAFLRNEYLSRKRSIGQIPGGSLVNQGTRVFIVGTLCGGTCSGTFIDLAYFVSEKLLGGRARATDTKQPEVVGVFTVPPLLQVTNPSASPNVKNTWAALRELDFYCQQGTRYSVTLADGEPMNTTNEPFDTVYLVSQANIANKNFPQWEGLSEMCALSLFTEATAGLAEPKAEIRVNYRSADAGYMQTNDKGYVRAFSSFGLSAIWYPRYRIAKAICRRAGMELATLCAGSKTFNRTLVEQDSAKSLDEVVKEVRAGLAGSGRKDHVPKNLANEIEQLFTDGEGEFLSLDEGGMDSFMVDFPSVEKPFASLFAKPEGEYYRLMSNSVSLVAKDCKEALQKQVNAYLEGHSLVECRQHVDHQLKLAKTLKDQLPDKLPGGVSTPDLGFASQVFHDGCSALLGMKGRAVQEYKGAIWNEFREATMAYLDKVRDYFLKEIAQMMVDELRSLGAKLQNCETVARGFRELCEQELKQQVKVEQKINVFVSSADDPNDLRDDVEQGYASILKVHAMESLKQLFIEAGGGTPLTFWKGEQADIMGCLDRAMDALAQGEVAKFQIGNEAIEQHRDQMQNLVQTTAPYIEPINGWERMPLPQSPNFLFCHDEEAGRELVRLTTSHLPGDQPYKLKSSPLDHFVIFYQEIPGLAISDLATSPDSARILDEYEANRKVGEQITNYSHKLGAKKFDLKKERAFAKVRDLVADTLVCAKEAFEWSDEAAVMTYKDLSGMDRTLVVTDEEEVRKYLDEKGGEDLKKHLLQKLEGAGREAVVKSINTHLAGLQPGSRERKEMEARLSRLLEVAFPKQVV